MSGVIQLSKVNLISLKFQFLIGSVWSDPAVTDAMMAIVFQFLIGSVWSRLGKLQAVVEQSFNSS